MSSRFVLLIHGGAGALQPGADDAPAVHAALRAAAGAGRDVLAAAGRALDAVVAAVASLESSGEFNAGRGAVRATDGSVSLDAALMDGGSRAAGAVAALSGYASAIGVARLVLERTAHVLLAGEGAARFAAESGVPLAPPGLFRPSARGRSPAAGHHGTVGAVARDADGAFAAATSTGGVPGKLPGRVGDSPLIGAGTYADACCAVSATGTGETFIRTVFAHRVATLVGAGRPVVEAAEAALAEVTALGGHGGCIALDAAGERALPFTTPGMFRAVADAAGVQTAIFR